MLKTYQRYLALFVIIDYIWMDGWMHVIDYIGPAVLKQRTNQ